MTNDAYYSALTARDRRFDGLFFVGVASTGIYCRPICSARTPAQKQCTFFPVAAAAEHAGFRPCLKCRPERAPRSPINRRSEHQIQQIASYIDETLLIDESIESVAERYDISTRHLRRLFNETFGVEPRQYLTTQRLLFAKQLLQDTTLPIDQVAYASGFGSVGRFYVQMKRSYQLTPAKLRQNVAKKQVTTSNIILRTDYRPPFAWDELLAFLAGRATPLEWVDASTYHRIVDSYEITVINDAAKNSLIIQIPSELASKSHKILARVRHMFDLSAQPTLIATHLSKDPVLNQTIQSYPGLRVPGCWDDFEMLIRVIIGQQVSVAGATTVMRRLIDAIGISPTEIAASTPEKIVKVGMPFRRAVTIWTVGDLVQSGSLRLDERHPKKLYDSLVAIPGIGPWTAEYISMRVQKWPDALPAGDLGLQKAAVPGKRITEKQLIAQGEKWRPWRSYATILLWRSLQNNGG